MRSYYSAARKRRQRAQKRSKLYQDFLENAGDYTQDIYTYKTVILERTPAAPSMPKDGFWLDATRNTAIQMNAVQKRIAQKEKQETAEKKKASYTGYAPHRRY